MTRNFFITDRECFDYFFSVYLDNSRIWNHLDSVRDQMVCDEFTRFTRERTRPHVCAAKGDRCCDVEVLKNIQIPARNNPPAVNSRTCLERQCAQKLKHVVCII